MTEAEARQWVAERFQGQFDAIDAYLQMVIAENRRQNLIAPSTVDQIWARHAVDSLQLVQFAVYGRWVDIGSGGGFPGLVIAIVRQDPVTLIEPRRKRADFLRGAVLDLGLKNAEILQQSAEQVERSAAVISARAVAGVERLLDLGARWAAPTTRWILPRGRVSEDDMTVLVRRFSMFHVEQSITSRDSAIIVANGRPA